MQDTPELVSPRPRVLVVHESRIMRASIVRHLKLAFDCVEHADMEQGWQTLLADPTIKAVLVDLSMPREEGVPFVARIAKCELPRVAGTSVIVIVSEDAHPGNAIEEARTHARAAGALDFIGKTTTPTEMLSRLQAAVRLSEANALIREQQAASKLNTPLDPKTGLMTWEYFQAAGQQLLSSAARHAKDLAVLAMSIDQLEGQDALFGVKLSPVITRQIARSIAQQLRREDTLAVRDDNQLFALVPAMEIADCVQLVRAIQEKAESTVMRYQGELIQVTLSIGAAHFPHDHPTDFSRLVEIASVRLIQARAVGEGAFEGATSTLVEEPSQPDTPSIERAEGEINLEDALKLLQSGDMKSVRPHLGRLAIHAQPFLRALEREFQLNFRLSRLREKAILAPSVVIAETGGTRESPYKAKQRTKKASRQ